jgi:hypothetical protein
MRIGPAVRASEDRHVTFDPVVKVRIYDPAGPVTLQPTPEALRLERQIRSMPIVTPPVAQQVQTESHSETAVGCYKNTLHTISMICGVAVLPSFACVAFGTLGLIAPAVLASIALTCSLLGGKPTEQMARARAQRAVEMSQYDPR